MSLSSSPALAALDPLDSGPYSFAGQEDKVLAFWTEIDAFGEQLKQSEGKPPYTFYDGQLLSRFFFGRDTARGFPVAE